MNQRREFRSVVSLPVMNRTHVITSNRSPAPLIDRSSPHRWALVGLIFGIGACLVVASRAVMACPFCNSVAMTFTEEMNTMQVVAIAYLEEAPPTPDTANADPTAPLPKAKFRVREVIKGSEWAKPEGLIEVLYFGDGNKDRPYLLMGTDPPNIVWSTPLGLSERGLKYVLQLPKLPADGTRLEFFQEHLEDADEMLGRDAYDEFAKSPYKDVVALGKKMHRDQLLKWIHSEQIPASRKRLYFTMLGVCHEQEDAALLQELMTSPDRKKKQGLDALLACYLLIRKEAGLPEIEDLFLKNAQAEYADTYAAIMAIRFHGSETNVIPRSRLIQSLRILLERAELADLVIPDLAKWEDWESMPRLIQLFKDADEKSSWVRVPVINYLRQCPLPAAAQAIEELAKIDAEAVKRAQAFPLPEPAGKTPTASGTPSSTQPTASPPTSEQPKPGDATQVVPAANDPATEGFAPPVTAPAVDAQVGTSDAAVPATAAQGTPSVDRATSEPSMADRSTRETAASRPLSRVGRKSPEPTSSVRRVMNHRWAWSVPVVAVVGFWSMLRCVMGLSPWGFRSS